MAKNRYINTRFWIDDYIANLDPIEKLLFLYFLTSPSTDICGVYEIPLKTVSSDTGIEVEMVKKILRRFARDKKIYYIDGWVGIMNFTKHQTMNPKVQIGIENGLSKAPKFILSRLFDSMNSVPTPIDSLSHSNPNLNSNSNLNNIATKVASPSKEKRNSEDPISLPAEIKKLEDSSQRHLNIIALYLENRKPDLRTWGQFQESISRHSRSASSLKKFENDQILTGFKKASKQTAEWTLETVLKNITK